MTKLTHLIVEQGEDKGLQIHVPPLGARLGRSSKNDVVMVDPLLSRHHCRLFFKPGDGLWIADLGSANQTVVNGNPIQESRLRVDDRVTLGDSVMKVLNDGITGVEAAAVGANAAAGSAPIDLGLSAEKAPAARTRLTRGPLIVILVLMLALAIVAWLPKLIKLVTRPPARQDVPAAVAEPSVEIAYEKVEATKDNIFRYNMHLGPDRVLSVQIDDIANNRHVRKEKTIDKDYIRGLAGSIENAGFFGLGDDYEGIEPDVLDSWDLSVTAGRKTHRTRVVNRVPPDTFKNVADSLEVCAKDELGLWATEVSPEKLTTMAQDAFLLGKKLYDERDVKNSNVADAIRSFTEAEGYLETIEPKPAYYGELLTALKDCQDLLTQKYNDQNFKAERAIKLREWGDAANALRALLDILPDRDDPRNQEARKKLLDMENRLKLQR